MNNRPMNAVQQNKNMLILLVVIGYINTFVTAAQGEWQFSAFQVVIGILFGVGYLILAMFDVKLLRPFQESVRNLVYFSI
jgi:DNA-binding transcriptional regulator of glucitol operon